MRKKTGGRLRRGARDRALADEGGMMYDATLSARDLRLHPTSECDGLRSVLKLMRYYAADSSPRSLTTLYGCIIAKQ